MSKMEKKQKFKKCKACGEQFAYFSSLQKVCSVACSLKHVRNEEMKTFNKETVRLKKTIKKRSKWVEEVQVEFNRFIRLRDAGQPCISCQNKAPKKINAGHYKSVGGHPELRFEECQVHLQCEHCNSFKSGNQVEYRRHLISKIGVDKVDWIEGPHEPKKYTI